MAVGKTVQAKNIAMRKFLYPLSCRCFWVYGGVLLCLRVVCVCVPVRICVCSVLLGWCVSVSDLWVSAIFSAFGFHFSLSFLCTPYFIFQVFFQFLCFFSTYSFLTAVDVIGWSMINKTDQLIAYVWNSTPANELLRAIHWYISKSTIPIYIQFHIQLLFKNNKFSSLSHCLIVD